MMEALVVVFLHSRTILFHVCAILANTSGKIFPERKASSTTPESSKARSHFCLDKMADK